MICDDEFIKLPNEILEMELSGPELMVYLAIARWEGTDDNYLAYSTIMKRTRLKSRMTISCALNKLISLGMIVRLSGKKGRKVNILYATNVSKWVGVRRGVH